ncbi:MAG: hypothetical protein ABF242_08890 [Flavobacteriales bacterium]
MKTITIYIFILLSFSLAGKAQTFCDTVFGSQFRIQVYQDEIDKFFNFDLDSLDFEKIEEVSTSKYILLNCNDSTFRIETLEVMVESEADEEVIYSSYSDKDEGTWSYDAGTKRIGFKLNQSKQWYYFKIKTKGVIGDKNYTSYTYKDDYRYLIRLVRVK